MKITVDALMDWSDEKLAEAVKASEKIYDLLLDEQDRRCAEGEIFKRSEHNENLNTHGNAKVAGLQQ